MLTLPVPNPLPSDVGASPLFRFLQLLARYLIKQARLIPDRSRLRVPGNWLRKSAAGQRYDLASLRVPISAIAVVPQCRKLAAHRKRLPAWVADEYGNVRAFR